MRGSRKNNKVGGQGGRREVRTCVTVLYVEFVLWIILGKGLLSVLVIIDVLFPCSRAEPIEIRYVGVL